MMSEHEKTGEAGQMLNGHEIADYAGVNPDVAVQWVKRIGFYAFRTAMFMRSISVDKQQLDRFLAENKQELASARRARTLREKKLAQRVKGAA